MNTHDNLHAEHDRDRLSLADLLGEIPWPDVWCSEAFIDRVSERRAAQSAHDDQAR